MSLKSSKAPSLLHGRILAGRGRKALSRTALALLAGLALAAPARAQTAPAQPLPVTVSPSGYEDPVAAEHRTRQERLLKRMQEDEFLFRNICVQCGGGVDGPGANAPFNPVQALSGRAGR
jgi:hypothetical protein